MLGKRMADGSRVQRNQLSQADLNSGVQETQLDPVKKAWHIFRGPPDYTHAVIPWIYEQQLSFTGFMRDYFIRMTSPYDPLIDPVGQDFNPGVGDAPGTVPNAADPRSFAGSAAYWDYYASIYKYYHVLGCRYKVRVENKSNEKFYVHEMFVTKSNPPPTASNWDMLIWPNVKHHLLHPQGIFFFEGGSNIETAEVFNINDDTDTGMNPAGDFNDQVGNGSTIQNKLGSPIAYIVGEYRPGDADRDVHEDTDVNIWTPVTQNPSLREALVIRLRGYDNASPPVAGNASDFERLLTFNITIECEYLVEFKELDDRLKWPTNRNPIVASIRNTNNNT